MRSSRRDNPIGSPNENRLVTVHGTFAARDCDEGESWWQIGGETSLGLETRLPHGTRTAGPGEVFHWSGENSERARIKAGQELLNFLTELEDKKQGYHLIGHSHGGSVIWHALRLAVLRGRSLEYLRSWATVGTPFLHHRTRGVCNLFNILNLLLAVLLLKPACIIFFALSRITFGTWLGRNGASPVSTGDLPERLSLLETPVLSVLDLLGISVSATGEGLRIGNFDSTRGDSLYEYLFMSPEGWLMLLVAMFVIYVYLNLGSFFLAPILESFRLRAEKRIESETVRTYQDRWLAIWSSDDEAINGLRATLRMSVSFVSHMAPRERVLFSDHLSLLSLPYYWVVTPIFNRLIQPFVNNWVRFLVTKTAQGNNRPAAEVVEVSPCPSRLIASERCKPIPVWLNSQLVEAADRHASRIVPFLRKLLAQPALVSGNELLGDAIQGDETIHTSYFDHPEILDLLILQIAWSDGGLNWLRTVKSKDERLVKWFTDVKCRGVGHQGHENVSCNRPPHAEPPPLARTTTEPSKKTA